jgi:hypothetical protein
LDADQKHINCGAVLHLKSIKGLKKLKLECKHLWQFYL